MVREHAKKAGIETPSASATADVKTKTKKH